MRRLWQGRHPYTGDALPDRFSRPVPVRSCSLQKGHAVQVWADTLAGCMQERPEENSFPLINGELPDRTAQVLGISS